MAKKQKRQVARTAAPVEKETANGYAPVAEATPTTRYRVSSSRTSGGSLSSEFNPDYSHVIQDLRRIGILAGSFIVILVVLSFILH